MFQYKYRTENEFAAFDFSEAQVGDMEMPDGIFHIVLDNVHILPDNSCNRDIRTMRTNELLFTVEFPKGLVVVEEGFKTYDANGVLQGMCEDRKLSREEYAKALEGIVGGSVYSAKKQAQGEKYEYHFIIDGTDDRTYAVTVLGSADHEEWNRFLTAGL